MYENLLKTVMNLGSPKVLVVGDFMLDVYVYGDADRISPEAPVPVLKVSRTEYRCGGAGSVANNLAALGASAYCLGVIGDDQTAKCSKINSLRPVWTSQGCSRYPAAPLSASRG